MQDVRSGGLPCPPHPLLFLPVPIPGTSPSQMWHMPSCLAWLPVPHHLVHTYMVASQQAFQIHILLRTPLRTSTISRHCESIIVCAGDRLGAPGVLALSSCTQPPTSRAPSHTSPIGHNVPSQGACLLVPSWVPVLHPPYSSPDLCWTIPGAMCPKHSPLAMQTTCT